MKGLLIVAAIVGLIYYFFLGGAKAPKEEKPEVIYQRQIEKVEQLPVQMQETVDQRMQEADAYQSGDQ